MSKLLSISSESWVPLIFKLCLALIIICDQTSASESVPDIRSDKSLETDLETESLCSGEWKSPQLCNTYNCDYKASWEYIDQK